MNHCKSEKLDCCNHGDRGSSHAQKRSFIVQGRQVAKHASRALGRCGWRQIGLTGVVYLLRIILKQICCPGRVLVKVDCHSLFDILIAELGHVDADFGSVNPRSSTLDLFLLFLIQLAAVGDSKDLRVFNLPSLRDKALLASHILLI